MKLRAVTIHSTPVDHATCQAEGCERPLNGTGWYVCEQRHGRVRQYAEDCCLPCAEAHAEMLCSQYEAQQEDR